MNSTGHCSNAFLYLRGLKIKDKAYGHEIHKGASDQTEIHIKRVCLSHASSLTVSK